MARRKTEEVIRLEAEAKTIEEFIARAPEEKLRSMLSSIFSNISLDYILRRQYPGAYMYEGEREHDKDEARDDFRSQIWDQFSDWMKRKE